MDDIFATIIYELRAFVKYLLSAWGLLSVASPFFPHYEKLQQYIRPPENNAELCITLASVVCGAVVLYRFVTRTSGNEASLNLLFGAIVLTIIYTFILPDWKEIDVGELMGISFEHSFILLILRSITKTIVPIWYILIFYMFTSGFTKLAVYEWNRRRYG